MIQGFVVLLPEIQATFHLSGVGVGALVTTRELADGDVFAIREAAGQAAQAIRGGGGPQFIECKTYRWREHVGPGEDYDDDYRTRDDLTPWQENGSVAITGNMLDDAGREAIDQDVREGLISADRAAAVYGA